jgi:hypothetical protein
MDFMVILISILYSIIATIINKVVKADKIYNKAMETAKLLKLYKNNLNISDEQMKELWSSYKYLLKENMKIYGTAILLFLVFYYYIIPTTVGASQKFNFIFYSLIFSLLINLPLYTIKHFSKHKNRKI